MFWLSGVTLGTTVFFIMSLLGLLLVVVSKSLVGAWCGMEISFFGAIPLMLGKASEDAEASFKYFLVQVVGSSLILVSFISALCESLVWPLWLFLIMGFSLKLGLFPFHSWVPNVCSLLSPGAILMVLVVQKAGPLWVLGGVGAPSCVLGSFLALGVVSSGVGSVGGLGQVSLRALLGYSSLSHSGWLISLGFMDWPMFLVYFLSYSFLLCGVLVMSSSRGFGLGLSTSCYLLSMGGLPPLVGALGKLTGIKSLMGASSLLVSLLVLSSVISLSYYVWMFISLNLKGVEVGFHSGGGPLKGLSHIIINILGGLIMICGVLLV